MTSDWRDVEMPPAIAKLPRNAAGYPVPWFVQWFGKDGGPPTEFGIGVPDFRIVDSRKVARAVREKRCFMCGHALFGVGTFPIGPMCAVNRISAEPPSHRVCGEYAARVCPWVTNPQKDRRAHDIEKAAVPGVMIERNPGVILLWTSRQWGLVQAPNGTLFSIGEPVDISWWAEGREATPAEILESFESGLPTLMGYAKLEGERAVAALNAQVATARKLLPA